MKLLLHCGVFVVALSSSAWAAPWAPKSKEANARIEQAAALFAGGDYAGAAAGFEAANQIESSNRAVWNAAQSHGAAGNWARALVLLDQLLADPELPPKNLPHVTARRKLAAAFVDGDRLLRAERFDEARHVYAGIAADSSIDASDRAQASKALVELDRRQEASREAAEAAADSPREAHTEAIPGKSEPTIEYPEHPPQQQRGRDVFGWSLVAAGLVVGGAGGAAWWSGSHLYAEARREPNETEARALFDRGDTRRIAGQVLIGAGVAVLAAGITKLVLHSHRSAPAVAFTPTPTGGGAVVLSGEF